MTAPSTTTAPAPVVDAAPSPIVLRLRKLLDAIDQQLHPDNDEFVGRVALRAALQSFLGSRNRLMVLVGPPGVGKTAFAAQLVREHCGDDVPYLAHFCSLPGGENPLALCAQLAAQLQALLGKEYVLPSTLNKQVNFDVDIDIGQATDNTRVVGIEVKELKIESMHPREAFRVLVREPLQTYADTFHRAPGDKPLVIVLDGIDRSWQWDGTQSNNIVGLLADAQDLPNWVNIVCLARPGAAVQALGSQAGVQIYEIDATGDDNLHDIAQFLHERFVGRLDGDARARLVAHLAAHDGVAPEAGLGSFVDRVVGASQGNFSYVRRYVGAWRLALNPVAGQPSVDAERLLHFDPSSLASVLNATYATIYQQVRGTLDTETNDADDDVLGALAIAFQPLTQPLIVLLSGWKGSNDALAESLARLAPVLESSGDDRPAYTLYHSGFREYVRTRLPMAARDRDLYAARVLEPLSDDEDVRAYSARYRWSHLLRSLDLSAAIHDFEPSQPHSTYADVPLDWRDGVARVRELAPDALIQAQLLRLLGARALAPREADVMGSWSAALSCLRQAEDTLRASRAIRRLERRHWRLEGGNAPPELLELEQTLLALGDAYRVIAQRLDTGGRHFETVSVERSWIFQAWGTIVRLPLTLYLLLVLLTQGVREIHFPGTLQNLGRGQDWAIARLYVLSVSAYRRARFYARQRLDETLDDDISERLARTYSLMGAYDAAAATYEQLLARPAALLSPWRQSMWMQALGDVALARGHAARAVETLTNALRVFQQQEAPVLQARTLSSLAAAHMLQAAESNQQPDGIASFDLDAKALAECNDALTVWRNVTTVEGDEHIEVDPALEISRVGHLLWELSRSERLSDEQARQALALRASIGERQYPQRFEHPLLRLFRVLATLLLPGIVLFGLLLAVQSPSTFLVSTDIELALQPPLLNLSTFPNNLVSSAGTLPASLTASDLAQLIAGAGWRQFVPAPPDLKAPAYSLQAVVSLALTVIGAYLLLYLLLGLLFLSLASPAHHQQRRPGRLIVSGDTLTWRGPPALGIWQETLRWARQEIAMLSQATSRRIATILGVEPRRSAPVFEYENFTVPLQAVDRAVSLARSERRRLLGDFSFTLIDVHRPDEYGPPTAAHARGTLYLPGSLMFYDELCDDLSRRLGTRWNSFRIEILRSLSGLFFLLTLLYTSLLVSLTALGVQALRSPLPLAGYSFSDLYVLAAPGLLLPLLWWLVAQPLAARSVRGGAMLPLTLAGLAGTGMAIAALIGGERLNVLQFQPDLFTPVLAIGILAALVINAPPRPLHRAFRWGWELVRTLIAIAAFVIVLLVTVQASITIAWYNALVQGNLAMRQGLATPGCANDPTCPALNEAFERYSALTCLRPGASEGYAFQGFAQVAAGNYDAARQHFFDALSTAQGNPPAAPAECLPVVASDVTPIRKAGLHANLAAASLLLARQQDGDTAEPFYQEALYNFLYALSNTEIAAGHSAEASTFLSALSPDQLLRCSSLAAELVENDADRGPLPADQAQYLLQMADTCYSRGFSRARAVARTPLFDQQTLIDDAWSDLSAAVTIYDAIAARGDEKAAILAQRGKAAAWLILGQFDRLPEGAPDRKSYLLRARDTYRQLERSGQQDEAVYSGLAWCSILLDGWGEARAPLADAARLNPTNPTYPALQGLVAWLDSTRFDDAPLANEPDSAYARAILEALDHYTHVIELTSQQRSQAYATRSVLYYSLRNVGRGAVYSDSDYGEWMQQAIGDMNQALVLAGDEQLSEAEQVGYHYWRGRLSFSLALTWQRRLRGLHSWDELVPLYSQAYGDFRTAVAHDPNGRRLSEYDSLRIPWTAYMLNNAQHMQQAQRLIRAGDFARARDELELVVPILTTQQKRDWDALGEPNPDYSLFHALIMLGLGEPADFANPLLDGPPSAEASIERAIRDADNNAIVEVRLRAAYYQQALADLEGVTNSLPAPQQALAQRIRTGLQERLAAAEAAADASLEPSDTIKP